MMEQEHFNIFTKRHYIRPQDFPVVDELLDWLIDKQRQGWKMSIRLLVLAEHERVHLRGGGEHWGMPRRTELADYSNQTGRWLRAFPCITLNYDWGTVGNQKFDVQQLSDMKKGCEPNCFSTLGYNVAYCYSSARVDEVAVEASPERLPGCKGSLSNSSEQ